MLHRKRLEQMKLQKILALTCALTLAACGGGGSGGGDITSGGTTAQLQQWPAHRPGEDPPLAPPEIEAVITNLDALAAMLPQDALVALFDPIAFGTTVRDISDPALIAFHVRAVLAQLQGGSRVDSPYHGYGHPDYNHAVELVPVEFHNRYGTRLYGEIVLPRRASVPPSAGPFPVILALQGLATNTSVYRWWHQVFADAGYLVFAFDFSGQGLSDNEAEGDPGNNIEEAQDALTYLLEQSPVRTVLDRSRVGVIGHSQGAITTMGLQAIEPRIHAAVAAAPISEDSAPFDANPIPVMIQTGDHDGPVAPIPFLNPAVQRAVYDKLTEDRAFIVTDAASHAQHTNYPLFPTSSWGLETAGLYSLAWMNYHLRGDQTALEILRNPHPHLSYLWDSEVRIGDEVTIYRGAVPALPIGP
jgi:pimeloyl-ACP methyl ester carboxylesterase